MIVAGYSKTITKTDRQHEKERNRTKQIHCRRVRILEHATSSIAEKAGKARLTSSGMPGTKRRERVKGQNLLSVFWEE